MHLIMLLTVLGLSWGLRYTCSASAGSWEERWQRALEGFLLPPLLLLSSAIAVIWMGPHGQMVWPWEGWLSYGLAICFIGFAGVLCLKLLVEGQKTLRQIRTYPTHQLQNKTIRVMDAGQLYSAQIGFWSPELVMSQGLLHTLDRAHLEAVLIHEQAHHYYRDTFYFFGLGWVRRVTAWLPQTQQLWQELLVLRELRADCWAAQQVDSLLLAEALLFVVKNPLCASEDFCVAFDTLTQPDRLTQRIEALLNGQSIAPSPSSAHFWTRIALSLTPLLSIPFHV